jgi:Kef-type K+ transport system membrane component KefB
VLKLVDLDVESTHPHFPLKLEAIGFGFFIPVFFVNSGLRFDLHSLLGDPSILLSVPIFVLALLAVRGIPAIPYRGVVGGRRLIPAALLQATSLPFIVAATQIGVELGVISSASAAALVTAGLISVLVFPALALRFLKQTSPPSQRWPDKSTTGA